MDNVTQVVTDRYAIYLNDCIVVMSQLPGRSIHFSIYSPPFAGLYHYSSNHRDMSNCRSYFEFMQNYDFAIEQIHRVTIPGRMTAVHCMDVPSGNSGLDHQMDFPGDIIEYHVKCRDEKCKAAEFEKRRGMCGHGWFDYVARYHVWKEPLGVRNRTMAKRLAHQTIVEDSSKCGVASADYLLVFRKKGVNPEPIEHPAGLTEYYGERQIPRELLQYRNWAGKQIENRYSHWIWRQYASAFWDDIRIDRVLPFKESKHEDDERHIHPLQLDVIDRGLILWTNLGDRVLTPFMGVGSEVYEAVRLGRFGIGAELKPSYFRQSVRNLETVDEVNPESLPLFDLDTLQ